MKTQTVFYGYSPFNFHRDLDIQEIHLVMQPQKKALRLHTSLPSWAGILLLAQVL